MVRKPPLPDSYSRPDWVNGWIHAPESNRNGHIWTSAEANQSVGVFAGVADEVRVTVFDDRADGFDCNTEPVRRSIRDGESEAEATAWGVERAVEWMRRHAPGDWSHPDIEEAVFDPPAGYVLDRYYIEQREQIIYYRRENAEKAVNLAGSFSPLETDNPEPQDRAYLVIKVWRGSGNATVALSPWLRAHDDQLYEVVETPDECGLSVALKSAREYINQYRDQTDRQLPPGQSGLTAW